MSDSPQYDLFDGGRDPWFDGATYDHDRDGKRLNAQYLRTFNLMRDGKFRTLVEIADATGDPPASISARLRDMRKDRFGAHTVTRLYLGDGLYAYQLILERGGNHGR